MTIPLWQGIVGVVAFFMAAGAIDLGYHWLRDRKAPERAALPNIDGMASPAICSGGLQVQPAPYQGEPGLEPLPDDLSS